MGSNHRPFYPLVVSQKIVEKVEVPLLWSGDFYVDDCLSGASSKQKAEDIMLGVIAELMKYGMELRNGHPMHQNLSGFTGELARNLKPGQAN